MVFLEREEGERIRLSCILYSLLQTVYVGYSYAFEECDYEQREISAEAVKQHEDVTASSVGEGHRDRAAHQTDRTYHQKKSRLFYSFFHNFLSFRRINLSL